MKLFDKFIDLFRVDEDNDEMTRKNEQETREETSNLDGEEVYDIDDITRPSKSQYQRGIRHQKKMLNLDLNGYKKLIVTSLLLRILSVVFGGAIVLGSCFLSP